MLNAYSKIVRHIYSYCFKNVHRVLFKMFNGYKNVQDIYLFFDFFYFGFGYSMSIQLFTMFLNFVQYILHNVQCVFAFSQKCSVRV